MHCQNTRFKQAQLGPKQTLYRLDKKNTTVRLKQKPQEVHMEQTSKHSPKTDALKTQTNTCTIDKDTGDTTHCSCMKKTTERNAEIRRRLIHRLNRMEGQIRGIRNMVEHDAYCPNILIQCAAVNAALNAFNRDLVAQHIRNCVTRDIKNGDDQVVDELVKTLQKLMK